MEIFVAYWVRRTKESCVKKDAWLCSECEGVFTRMLCVVGRTTTCPHCHCRLVLNYKNKA
jgi:hypothetical protein